VDEVVITSHFSGRLTFGKVTFSRVMRMNLKRVRNANKRIGVLLQNEKLNKGVLLNK